MSDEQVDPLIIQSKTEPEFMSDLIESLGMVFLVILGWYLFFFFVYPSLFILLGELLGFFASIIIMMFFLTFTFTKVGEFMSVIAYRTASSRTGLPYMNYETKCPFLKRRYLNFTCIAEQIEEFDVPAMERCHKEFMWLDCWSQRVPSIISVFDTLPPKKQQQLAFLLGAMKERAHEASMKMQEVLTGELYEMDVRLSAAYALAEMKEERGIEPLFALLGQTEARQETTVRAVITRFGDLAVPYVTTALEECTDDTKCGALVEILGKIGTENAVPTLDKLLNEPTSEDYTLLQTIYALHEIGTKKAYEVLIKFLEIAQEEEKSTIKDVIMNKKLVTFPILIELLTDESISEDYYAEIGDILAQVPASTYEKLFAKLEDEELVKRLAAILKDHTPEDEEFGPLHTILDGYAE